MDNLMYSVASEDDIVFINETYNENIDRLHGVQRNVDVWKELMSCKDSTYYVVNAETPVAWFRIDMEDGGLWIGMLQVKPMYQHKGIGKYVLSAAENIARELASQLNQIEQSTIKVVSSNVEEVKVVFSDKDEKVTIDNRVTNQTEEVVILRFK